ncbi:bola-like protein [Flagelloscypha sp. PMI_526]|nr:bola-like protein [Flagelloscypha sp. PMI_526]
MLTRLPIVRRLVITAVPSSPTLRPMSTTTKCSAGPVETSIARKLTALLNPTVLEISNDSEQHRHHREMKEQGGAETHFSVQIVSEAFTAKTSLQRHRMIHGALAEEFQRGLHSLSLKTATPAELLKP